MLPVVVFLRRQVQNQIGTQQQSRIGLGTQNLARHNVHQIGETFPLAGTSPFPGFRSDWGYTVVDTVVDTVVGTVVGTVVDTAVDAAVDAVVDTASPFPDSDGNQLMHMRSISIQDCYRGKIRNWIRGKGGGPMSPGIGPLSTLNI